MGVYHFLGWNSSEVNTANAENDEVVQSNEKTEVIELNQKVDETQPNGTSGQTESHTQPD